MRQCLICEKEFKPRAFVVRFGAGRYCSRQCYHQSMKGHKRNTGRKHTPQVIQKMKDSARARNLQSPPPQWGNKYGLKQNKHSAVLVLENPLSYKAPHDWIKGQKGSPSFCEKCGTTKSKRFDWHNISREYKRTLNDWQRLCVMCHNQTFKHRNKWSKL